MKSSLNQILIEKVENGFVIRVQRTVPTPRSLFSRESSDNCKWYVASTVDEAAKLLRDKLPNLKTSIEIEEEEEAKREAAEEDEDKEEAE